MKYVVFFIIYLSTIYCSYSKVSTLQNSFSDSNILKTNSVNNYCNTSLGGRSFDITEVSINGTSLNNTSPRPTTPEIIESVYKFFDPIDYNTCILVKGNTYTFNVKSTNSNIISLWIDYNQNRVFEASEWTQVSLNSSWMTPTVNIKIPTTALVGETCLRIRTRGASNTNGPSEACNSFNSGCTEDYTITIFDSISSKPVVKFATKSIITTKGKQIQFSDFTFGNPKSWQWTFEGATPTTSTEQNPVVTYTENGLYAVKLVATNSIGTDSLKKTAYITVSDEINMLLNGTSSATTCGLMIYDNGGKTNYAKSSNDVLTIKSGTEGSAVKLLFREFNIATNDYLNIYNGTSISDNLISSYSGSKLPFSIIASNHTGALTLQLISTNYSTTASGFIAQAFCVPLISQSIDFVIWYNSLDNNQNTYSQKKELYYYIKNNDSNPATLFVKTYSKFSSDSLYTLKSTSSLIVNANSTSAKQTYIASDFSIQNTYDFKIELYNATNTLLRSYDMTNNNILGGHRFESISDDILPSYCISNLKGSVFDISAVSISGTTLNNKTDRPAIKSYDGSFYTLFEPTTSNTCSLTAGKQYTLNVTSQSYGNICSWIDYNNDFSFHSNERTLVTPNGTVGKTYSVSIIIPENAIIGQTRMRIRTNSQFNIEGTLAACFEASFGCTEDYVITIEKPTELNKNFIQDLKFNFNQSEEVLKISVPEFASGKLIISDIVGRSIVVKRIRGEITVNTSNFYNGLYIVSFHSDNGISYRRQVLLSK